MKKLLLVGVVGLSALLAGCGGGGDCEEETLPPVTEASFPNGQAPEYIVRQPDDIGFSRVGSTDFPSQVIALEMGGLGEHEEYRVTKVVVQEFEADYSQGYLTKPTTNVHEYKYAEFKTFLGRTSYELTSYDIKKVSKSLLTVQRRGGSNDLDGNFQPVFEVSFNALGILNEATEDSFTINGIKYPRGIADDNEGGVDIVVGGYVVGMLDGDKMNIAKLSFAGPASGVLMNVKVNQVFDETSFSYLDADGNDVKVTLREPAPYEKTDRVFDTSTLSYGEIVVVTASEVDYNNQEVLNADVFELSK